MTGTALLVDGDNNLVRATHAAYGSQMGVAGTNTGPLQIFINTLSKHVREEEPARLIVAWDHPSKDNWRKALLPTYKANRRTAGHKDDDMRRLRESNFALAREFCALAGATQVTMPGFEADDLIAGAWHGITPEQADKIVILSNDSDFMQLVGDNPHGVPTEQVRLSSGKGAGRADTDRWTAARVRTGLKEGPVPGPSVLGALKALQGDTSDNVPGLRGIGPKRALQLLERHNWDIQSVMDSLDEEQKALIVLNLRLVGLRTQELPVPVPKWRPTSVSSLTFSPLRVFLDRYQMRTVTERLVAGSLWADPADLDTEAGAGFVFSPGQ